MIPLVDLLPWAKRNIWRLPSGELCARPGFRLVKQPESGRLFVGGFSVPRAHTGELTHYAFDVASATRPYDLRARVYDDVYTLIQTLQLNIDAIPRVITHSVVEQQLTVAGPDIPTLWSHVGVRMLKIAEPVDSVLSNAPVLPIPRGVCTSWSNRNVLCTPEGAILISDPVSITGGDVRTYLAANQNGRESSIYGVHKAAGGMLAVVTAEGVYGLDVSAAAVGIVGSNGSDWRLLSDHRSQSFASSCVIDGRLYVLTKNGVMLADVEDGAERVLTEPIVSRAFASRFAIDDHRECQLFAGEFGPIVSSKALDAFHMHDRHSGVGSWWQRNSSLTLNGPPVGLWRDADGGDLLMFPSGVFRVVGNSDNDAGIEDGLTVSASLAGLIPTNPLESLRVREIRAMAAVAGSHQKMRFALRGIKSADITLNVAEGQIGEGDSWGTGRYQSTPMQVASARLTDPPVADVNVEIGVDGGSARISKHVGVVYDESSTSRPGKRP